MPNFSGIWSAAQQFQARGQNIWPKPPCAPTIGTATAGSSLCASVTFSAPACTGKYPSGISSYTVTSTPGGFTASGAASPLTVTGLTNATSYTFKVKANGSNGLTGPCSASSNSITASNAGSQSYTSSGTYSWVAPAGVTSVSVVAVGGGGSGDASTSPKAGGAGGNLRYANNISVTPGSSYTVVVGAGGASRSWGNNGLPGGDSSFNATSVLARGGGSSTTQYGTGGDGGAGGFVSGMSGYGGGGGAGGYSGNGGDGGYSAASAVNGSSGSGGGGGGGGGSNTSGGTAGGGGVGILGSGASGSGGTTYLWGSGLPSNGGGGGSGGATGGQGQRTVSGCGINGYGGAGGAYGGGGGAATSTTQPSGAGAVGAVRIIWPGNTRSFPSTNAGNP